MDHIEHKMSEYTSSFNTLVDVHTAQNENITWMTDEIADLEDRSRRNNIRLRGIPEYAPATQLHHHIQDLFSALASSLSTQDLAVDRIHRVPKPSFLPGEIPRDVMLRVHFYHVKEQLLSSFCRSENVLAQYANLKLLPDLSRYTLQHHRNLVTITKALRNYKVPHKWKYPATLSITHNGITISVNSIEEGLGSLQQKGYHPRACTNCYAYVATAVAPR